MNVKQVIVIRRDLNARRGKEIAQGGHAACSWLAKYVKKMQFMFFMEVFMLAVIGAGAGYVILLCWPKDWYVAILGVVGIIWAGYSSVKNRDLTLEQKEWLYGRFTKVTLQVPDEKGLMDIFNQAQAAGLDVHLITDSGVTEFHGVPTNTCLAIGPHEAYKIDPITGHLKIY